MEETHLACHLFLDFLSFVAPSHVLFLQIQIPLNLCAFAQNFLQMGVCSTLHITLELLAI